MLGEVATCYDVVAFFLIVTGATACVLLSNGQVVTYTADELYRILSTAQSIFLMILSYAFIFGSILFYYRIEQKLLQFCDDVAVAKKR